MVSLFDLLTVYGVVVPAISAAILCSKFGPVGAAVGLVVGGLFGLVGVFTLRRFALYITSRGSKGAGPLLLLVYIVMFAWSFVASFLAVGATTGILRYVKI